MGNLRGVVAAGVTALVLVAGCGAGPDELDPVVASAQAPPTPSALTCPSGEMVGTAGGLLAKWPDGFDTPRQAVRVWLSTSDWPDADFVLSDDATEAWVLRDDGTAQARVGLLEHDGFTVHGYDACSP